MQDQVHISPQNLGQGKTHIPQQFQQRLLQESNAVTDAIIIKDVDTYSDALKLTLGTVRAAMKSPNRMLARLRDRHGFTVDDLKVFLRVPIHNIPYHVRVRQHSIISRSAEERIQEITTGLQLQIISPKQAAIALAEELERPLIQPHELQLKFCENSIRQIVAGAEWPGMPHLDVEMFVHTAERAMWGLDILKDEDRAAIKRLQEAILIQKQLSLENQMPPQGLDQQGGNGIQSPSGSQNPGQPQGAPASINPMTSPVGAAGGLPAGLA
jgi:hypothetical protein